MSEEAEGLVKRRKSFGWELDNPEFREQLLRMVAFGMTQKAVAEACGITLAKLRQWLSRGRGEPDVEPFGSFAVDYARYSRITDIAASQYWSIYVHQVRQHAQDRVAQIEHLPAMERVDARAQLVQDLAPHIDPLMRILRSRRPDEHGDSKHRLVEGDITGDEWLQEKALTVGQIRGALQNPGPSMEEALRAEAETVVMRLLESGWLPSLEIRDRITRAPVPPAPEPVRPAPEPPRKPPSP